MGREIVYCSRCYERLKGPDLDEGRARRINHQVVCDACLVPSERKAAELPPAATPSRGIRRAPAGGTPPPAPAAAPARKPVLLWAGAGGGGLLILVVILVLALRSPAPPPTVALPPPKAVPKPAPAAPSPVDDLKPLREELEGLLARRNFAEAAALLERSRRASREPRRIRTFGDWEMELQAKVQERFHHLTESRGKGPESAKAARDEVHSWGPAFASLLKDFDATAAAPKPEPPPAPAPKPETPPAPPSKAALQYRAAWDAAMSLVSRREPAKAAASLQAAIRDLPEDEAVKTEAAADLQDLRRLAALQEDFLRSLQAAPPGEELDLGILQEEGLVKRVKTRLVRVDGKRLELSGEVRFVELEDVSIGTLARLHAKKAAAEDARALAVAALADGDEVGGRAWKARPLEGEALVARKNEQAAKKLFYEAEGEAEALETRPAAMEKYLKLSETYGTTMFAQKVAPEIASRKAECRDYPLTAARLSGTGIFSSLKTPVPVGKEKDKVEMLVWRAREDSEEHPDQHVEATFYALPGTEYKAWALVGGCCVSTFSWLLQATEFTTPDRKTRKPLACDPGGNVAAGWEHRLRGLSSTHGGKDHSKAPKEPSIWEWAELPLPRYASGGLKRIRLIGAGKGMSVAAVVVSADRAKKPGDEDTRALAKASLEEDLPPSAIRAGKGAPDLQIQIPEARRMTLVYDLDLAKLKRPVAYDVDRAAKVTQPFDRIGYLLELERGAEAQFVFVSMDAFTAEAAKIGIPDAEGTVFQKPVTGMCILSNVPGVATGQRLEGNLEFWPNNYGGGNGANVPGASASTYDFGDQPGAPASGYGSMQVHHAKGKQTVFAINKWNAGGSGADIGIGNSPSGNPDWTFTGSGKTYASKRLRIYVRLR